MTKLSGYRVPFLTAGYPVEQKCQSTVVLQINGPGPFLTAGYPFLTAGYRLSRSVITWFCRLSGDRVPFLTAGYPLPD